MTGTASGVTDDELRPCRCCEIVEELSRAPGRRLHYLGPAWTLNANVDAVRPALVLQLRRHVAHLGALTRLESDALGGILTVVEAEVRAELKPERVHFLLLGESAAHVHFHVVPRWDGDGPVFGIDLLDVPPPDGVVDASGDQIASRVAKGVVDGLRLTARPPEPSPIVRWVINALDKAQRLTPYDAGLARWRQSLARDRHVRSFPRVVESALHAVGLPRNKRVSADFATVYVLGWLTALMACTVFVSPLRRLAHSLRLWLLSRRGGHLTSPRSRCAASSDPARRQCRELRADAPLPRHRCRRAGSRPRHPDRRH